MTYRIGFISTRFAGTDGVSLEAGKWAHVFEQNNHACFWFAGELDQDINKSFLVPEAHFKHEHNHWINNHVFGKTGRSHHVTEFIHASRAFIKERLHRFIKKFSIDLLIAENVLTIPMHIPLGLALSETIAETEIPTIAHHHDFFWERDRFALNAVNDYLQMAFPPRLPNIKHVVINSNAQEQLALRNGIAATLIPNVLDFENPPKVNTRASRQFRNSIGLTTDDKIILQPTRVIQRKGIEHAIELVRSLKDPAYKLIISHAAGDEGYEYAEWVQAYARERSVDVRLVATEINPHFPGIGPKKSKYTLWDVYAYADFITYPSLYEGFGNAFLEAVYLRKPILVNRYSTFIRDIEPLGFQLAIMNGYLSPKTVAQVKTILACPQKSEAMVNHNYSLAKQYFSYTVLRRHLNYILESFFRRSVGLETIQPKEISNIVYLNSQSPYRHKAGPNAL